MADSTARRRVAIASDHAGFELKAHLVVYLGARDDIDVADLGPGDTIRVDYPDYARKVTAALNEGRADTGILVCGTGIGMSMAANREPGIRAALCADTYTAAMARAHNDAQILCIGSRVIGPGVAESIADAFLAGEFEGGRHVGRLAKIDAREL